MKTKKAARIRLIAPEYRLLPMMEQELMDALRMTDCYGSLNY